ncbi:MAG: NADP oxidoreductase [Phycisphaeraceae bacterium]|nr:NADP oxidoreductase [Phycisphaeraceae bacterium]
MNKIKVATVWLDGCSGCHMSLLDIDERILELAKHIEIVYSPIVDAKKLPEAGVDLGIIEGAIANEEDKHKAEMMRAKCKFLIALGDCAVTGNVPSMRNPFGIPAIFKRAYHENATVQQQDPKIGVPALLETTTPVHEVVKVDLYVPGCPPPADAIFFVLSELIAGRVPDPSKVTRFGA